MLQSEFIRRFCERSEITEEELNRMGIFAIVCDCGEEECKGWAMTTRENVKGHIEIYIKRKL